MAGKIVIVVWLVVLAIAPFPLAYAQQPKKVVGRSNSPPPNIEAFRQGLRDLGYVEGENIVIEHRNAEGKENRLADLAAELIRLKVDIIVAQSTTGLLINYHSAGCPDGCNSKRKRSRSMSNGDTIQRLDIVELRLFIEELTCSICRFMHASQDGVEPQSVRIKQEVQLGTPNAFADIVLRAPGMAPYIVEVDYGYSLERIAESLSRKYQRELGWFKSISKLILIFDRDNHPDDQELEKHVRTLIPIHWQLELWDEYRLMVTSTARRCHSFGCCRGPKGPDPGLPREGTAGDLFVARQGGDSDEVNLWFCIQGAQGGQTTLWGQVAFAPIIRLHRR